MISMFPLRPPSWYLLIPSFFDMWHVMMCVTFCVSCYCMATSITKMSVLLSLITILMNVNICLLKYNYRQGQPLLKNETPPTCRRKKYLTLQLAKLQQKNQVANKRWDITMVGMLTSFSPVFQLRGRLVGHGIRQKKKGWSSWPSLSKWHDMARNGLCGKGTSMRFGK